VVLQLEAWAWGYLPLTVKNYLVMKCHRGPLTCVDSSDKRPHEGKMDMRFDIWNIRRLYRTGSLKTVVKEVSTYELDLVGVQEVRWDRGGTELTGNFTFVYGMGNENH
jgi:hypothetical protein